MERRETQVTPLVEPPVTLHVIERGNRSAATHVLLLHGFPDDQTMWEPVVEALPHDWHVITVDNRGAGRSSRPRGGDAYRMAMLVEDTVAVLDATVPPGEKVHLVAHDWGSVAGWDLVAAATWDPRLEDRLASYTSLSGPSLDHTASVLEDWRGRVRMLPQVLHSWYAIGFLLPWLPELLWGPLQRLTRPLARRLDRTTTLLPWGREVATNARHSLGLYRANLLPRTRHAVRWRTSLPVLLVVALRDAFVVPRAFDGLEARCRDLTRVEVDEGHWLPRARPQELAGLVEEFVRSRS